MADATAAPPADQAKKKAKAKKMEKPEKPPEEQGEKAEKKKKKEKAAEPPPAESGEAAKPPEPAAPPEESKPPPAPEGESPAPEGEAPLPAPETTPQPPDTSTEGEPAGSEAPPPEEQAEAAPVEGEEAEVVENEQVEKHEVQTPRKPSVVERNIMARIDEAKLQELQEAFELMDINGDGFIDAKDLQLTFVTLGRTPEDTEIMEMISEAPKPMDFEGFVNLLGSRTIDLDPEDIFMAALSLWDKEGKGLIDEEMFRMSLTGWGDKFTQEEVDIVLGDAPYYTQSGTPMINYIEFCKQISSSAIKKS